MSRRDRGPVASALRALASLAALRWLTALLGRLRRPGDRPPRDPTGERVVAGALLASVAGSVGFAVVYVVDAGPRWEGVTLGLALGALGVALVVWGRRVVPHRVVVEERPTWGATAEERRATAESVDRGGVPRRSFLVRLAGLAVGALGLSALFPIASLGPAPGERLRRTGWRAGARLVTPDGAPVALDRVPVGGILTVFPEGHTDLPDAQTVLVRLPPGEAAPAGGTDPSVAGYVAFSQVCTHAGCPVGLYQQESRRLMCPCHQSVFDVRDDARPVDGPATRPLPRLPLGVDEDGFLTARADFSAAVGPIEWDEAWS